MAASLRSTRPVAKAVLPNGTGRDKLSALRGILTVNARAGMSFRGAAPPLRFSIRRADQLRLSYDHQPYRRAHRGSHRIRRWRGGDSNPRFRSAAEGPMVRRLPAGGRWIRTIGTPQTFFGSPRRSPQFISAI